MKRSVRRHRLSSIDLSFVHTHIYTYPPLTHISLWIIKNCYRTKTFVTKCHANIAENNHSNKDLGVPNFRIEGPDSAQKVFQSTPGVSLIPTWHDMLGFGLWEQSWKSVIHWHTDSHIHYMAESLVRRLTRSAIFRLPLSLEFEFVRGQPCF